MGRPRSQHARERALTATAELALETGLASVTIDEVARRSGVAKTTIYRHFEHRNALLIAAIDQTTDAPRTPNTGSLDADLVEFYTDLIPIFQDARVRTLSLEIYAAASRDPALRELQQAFFSQRMRPIQTIVRRAVERGEIAPVDDFITIVEIVHGRLIVRSLTAPDTIASLDPAELAHAAVDRLAAISAATRVRSPSSSLTGSPR